ncbi:MAG: hypothetical protein COC01_05645 [Bacteroidetes bacterium]|nr:hypothetical protein [Bacteroidia bacterium]PCH67542.1 MAG: hypothetical protein COC01_05645 [Bacteroidota bacterium]
MKIFYLLLTVIIVTLSSCAPTRIVKPLKKGEKTASFHFGGPIIRYSNFNIPVPFTSLTYAYGFTNELTLFNSLHTTTLLYKTVHTEFGTLINIYDPKCYGYRPWITISHVANILFDTRKYNVKYWPQLDINAYWHYKQKDNYFYLGLSNWFEFASHKAHEERQTDHYFLSPYAGHTFSGKKMEYTLEFKYLTPYISNQLSVVEKNSFGKKGVNGIYINITRKF